MKKFNLQEALNGAKVVTRNGKEIKEIHLFKTIQDKPLYVVIESLKHNINVCVRYDIDGCFLSDKDESDYDLFMKVEKQSFNYMNVYKDNEGGVYVDKDIFDTYYQAKKNIKNKYKYIKTISITLQQSKLMKQR